MIAMDKDSNENEPTEEDIDRAVEMLMMMIQGLEEHGSDYNGYWYMSLEDALEAWNRRELYIINDRLIKISNGRPVQISMNGKLLNNFPQEIIGILS